MPTSGDKPTSRAIRSRFVGELLRRQARRAALLDLSDDVLIQAVALLDVSDRVGDQRAAKELIDLAARLERTEMAMRDAAADELTRIAIVAERRQLDVREREVDETLASLSRHADVGIGRQQSTTEKLHRVKRILRAERRRTEFLSPPDSSLGK